KRTLLYCLISGVLGGLTAVAISRHPTLESSSDAQQPAATSAAAVAPQTVADAQPYPPAPAAARPATAQPSEYTAREQITIWVYEQVNRSVVNITTKGYQGERAMLFESPSEGEGSGMVIDREGHVLTNFHVVDNARQIQVTLFDGNNYEARLVGQDPATD